MIDLEKRIEDAIKLYCDNKDSMHVPPKDTDIDVVLSDCLKEITELKQKLEKIESGEFVLVPREPTKEMWGGFARQLGRYVQTHDRFSPLSLDRYIKRFVGEKNRPLFLNKEIANWDSDHAFATADLPVFIYKAMIEAVEKDHG